MSDNWQKVVSVTPRRDWRYLTCGGVLELETSEFEAELANPPRGPKLGEAEFGEDEG